MTTKHADRDAINHEVTEAGEDAEIERLTAEIEIAKQALADAERRYSEVITYTEVQ